MNLSDLKWTLTAADSSQTYILNKSDFNDLTEFLPEGKGVVHLYTEFVIPGHSEINTDDLYGLYGGRIILADRFLFNGSLIGQTGRFPPDWFNDWNKDRFYSIPASLVKLSENNSLQIDIYINDEGRIGGPLLFGPYEDVHSIYLGQRFLHQDLNAFISGLFLFFGLYNFAIFLRRKQDREFLWFSLLSFVFALNQTSLFYTAVPWFNPDILSPLQWMKFYAIVEVILVFTALRFFEHFGRLPERTYKIVLFFSIPIVLLLVIMFHENYGHLRRSMGYFEISLLFPLVYFLYRLYKNRNESRRIIPLITYGFVPAMVTILHDITLPHLISGYSFFVAGAGIPLFLMTTNIILAREFVKDRDTIEEMNRNLESLIQERSRDLIRANEKISALSKIDRFLEEFDLTPREKEILRSILGGLTNDIIAESLSVSIRTVNTHLYNLYRKLGVHSRVEIFSRFSDFK